MIRQHADSLAFEATRGFGHVTGLHDARIGDEKRALKMELARQLPDAFDGALPENDACARLKIEWDHLQ